MPDLPPSPLNQPHEPWLSELRKYLYEGPHSQAILTGNTRDIFRIGEDKVANLDEILLAEYQSCAGVVLRLSEVGEISLLKFDPVSHPTQEIHRKLEITDLPVGRHDTFSEAVRLLDSLFQALSSGSRVLLGVVYVIIHLPRPLAKINLLVPELEANRLAESIAFWSAPSAQDDPYFRTLLVAESPLFLHPALAENRLAARVTVPYPGSSSLDLPSFPLGQRFGADLPEARETGYPVSLAKELVGHEEVREHLQQDFQLWKQGDTKALARHFLLCGPAGTGKQALARAAAAQAGHAVYVPEGAYYLQRPGQPFDISDWLLQVQAQPGGVLLFPDAERLPGFGLAPSEAQPEIAAITQHYLREFLKADKKRRFLVFTTSSRPDLLVPYSLLTGGEHFSLPLFPTSHTHEGFRLIRSILQHRFDLELAETDYYAVEENIPWLLTAAEAYLLAAKTYRQVRLKNALVAKAFNRAAKQHHSPLDNKVLEYQIRVAMEESAEPGFVPELIRNHFTAP